MFKILDEIRDLMEAGLTTSFNKYYVGKIETPPVNYLPVLSVYPLSNELSDELSTNRDKYLYTIAIEIFTSPFGKVNVAEDSDKIFQAQKQLWDLMEETDSNNIPKATTVLGILRRNITGTSFLFNNNIRIEYTDFKVADRQFFKAQLITDLTTRFNSRS